MTSGGARLMRTPLFSPLNLIERHHNPRRLGGKSTLREPKHTTAPSVHPAPPITLTNPCWIGECPGCGKTLISATWELSHLPVYCSRRCKETHAADL